MRTVTKINGNWAFSLEAKAVPASYPSDWKVLDLPYTWNGEDGQDGGNDYYRGKGYFAKELSAADFGTNDVHYLQFDGVNSSAEIYFNGKKLAEHHGGYSTFRVKVEDIKENNLLVVVADNTANDRVYPQTADFTFYGGIYRDVKIVSVGKNHFDLDYYGAPGIKVTPEIKGADAEIEIETYFDCKDAKVKYEIIADGEVIAEKTDDDDAEFEIKNVHLWDGLKDPYLYTAKATLIVDGEEVDEISTRFGCRSFKIDPEKGFILNGREYPLRGVSRHQDNPGIGNALLYEHHKRDVDLIVEMGANTIRLAHSQHSQDFYDLCDEAGLVI